MDERQFVVLNILVALNEQMDEPLTLSALSAVLSDPRIGLKWSAEDIKSVIGELHKQEYIGLRQKGNTVIVTLRPKVLESIAKESGFGPGEEDYNLDEDEGPYKEDTGEDEDIEEDSYEESVETAEDTDVGSKESARERAFKQWDKEDEKASPSTDVPKIKFVGGGGPKPKVSTAIGFRFK